jgi:hypothetical protein
VEGERPSCLGMREAFLSWDERGLLVLAKTWREPRMPYHLSPTCVVCPCGERVVEDGCTGGWVDGWTGFSGDGVVDKVWWTTCGG